MRLHILLLLLIISQHSVAMNFSNLSCDHKLIIWLHLDNESQRTFKLLNKNLYQFHTEKRLQEKEYITQLIAATEKTKLEDNNTTFDKLIKLPNIHLQHIHNQIYTLLNIIPSAENSKKIYQDIHPVNQNVLSIALHNKTPLLLFIFKKQNPELCKTQLTNKLFEICKKTQYKPQDLSDIEILLNMGIPINNQDNYGCTALMWAVINGHTYIVNLLLKQKEIDINAKDKLFGHTALILAAKNGHTYIVKLLLKQKGIDADAKNNWERTALMFASQRGHIDIFKLLNNHAAYK